jgi:endonuclease/exonuclease/phosphatase family metal-dependent hydrolase
MRLSILLILISCTVQAQTLKVMTYNIRLNIASDGVNAWPNRKEKVAGLMTRINPDVIGVQEALYDQVQYLASALPGYAYVGVGRDDGKEKGEFTAVFYKKEKLLLVSNRNFWLSETPEVPGSMGWDAATTRMANWVLFEDVSSLKKFIIVNTHFDHIGKVAQQNSAAYLLGIIAGSRVEQNVPVVFCGDLNVEPTEKTYESITSASSMENRLLDSRPPGYTQATFCGFEKGKFPCRTIDYIFHSREWGVQAFEVVADNDGPFYPSDHLPVVATLLLLQ